jgi:hypothetical protein
MLYLNRANGKASHCAGCGRELVKGAGLAYKFDGNTVGCLCGNCLNGELPIGKRAWKFHTTDEQTTDAKTTKNHTVKAVITNPHTALDTFINFGGIVEKIEDNGDIVVTIADQKACYKVGHFFNEDRLADNFKQVFVNDGIDYKPVNNLEEYHKVVKVQG